MTFLITVTISPISRKQLLPSVPPVIHRRAIFPITDETGERKGVNGHVSQNATISTKKVNFEMASADAMCAVPCSNPSNQCDGGQRGHETKDRHARSETSQTHPHRSLSSPPSSTLTPRTVLDVVRTQKEPLIQEDGVSQ